MRYLSQLVLAVLGMIVWALAVLVFLIGVPLLVNRDLTPAESIGGVLLYTSIALALGYGGWRLFVSARGMTRT